MYYISLYIVYKHLSIFNLRKAVISKWIYTILRILTKYIFYPIYFILFIYLFLI